jgi:hypothetical protein
LVGRNSSVLTGRIIPVFLIFSCGKKELRKEWRNKGYRGLLINDEEPAGGE